MTTERPRPAKVYTDKDLAPIMDGKVPLPNVEWLDTPRALASLCLGGWTVPPDSGRALVAGTGGYGSWARYFLGRGQFGGLDGTGYVIVYDSGTDATNWQATGRIASFAICRHEKVEGPGANHMRGYHPGWCSKCGYDMTVDSGD